MSTSPEKLLQLTEVELAFGRGSSKERRKYFTLIEETGTARRGGLGETARVRTMAGEPLACKKLLLPDREAFGSQDAYDAEVGHRERAFREEYETLCRLSSFKGFVKVRAYGHLGDVPLILMEWVEGVSAGHAAPLLKRRPDSPGADPLAVAQIGRDVFHLLARLEAETELFVHRDLSASNIMIRTRERPLEGQAAEGRFDVCFIDFGSAATLRAGDGSFTTDTRILRGATPGYAPPEMLSNDLPRLEELRRSTKIDVYAACSVLYEMACGHLPFDVVGRTGSGSDYLFKMMNDPAPSGFASGTVEQLLVDIVGCGIHATQDARCSSSALYNMLGHYVDRYDENVRRARSGRPLDALSVREAERLGFDAGRTTRAAVDAAAGHRRASSERDRFGDAETRSLDGEGASGGYDETVALAPDMSDSAETVIVSSGAIGYTVAGAHRPSSGRYPAQGQAQGGWVPGATGGVPLRAGNSRPSASPGASGYMGPVRAMGYASPAQQVGQRGQSLTPGVSGRIAANEEIAERRRTRLPRAASIAVGVVVGVIIAALIWFLAIAPNLS